MRRVSSGRTCSARLAARLRWATLVPLFAMLPACTGAPSDTFGSSVWVTPGKYQFHNCLQAQQAMTGVKSRIQQIEELMARAEKGPGGAAVNFMVYRTEYQQAQGEREQLEVVLQQKRCNIESPRTSERQVF